MSKSILLRDPEVHPSSFQIHGDQYILTLISVRLQEHIYISSCVDLTDRIIYSRIVAVATDHALPRSPNRTVFCLRLATRAPRPRMEGALRRVPGAPSLCLWFTDLALTYFCLLDK